MAALAGAACLACHGARHPRGGASDADARVVLYRDGALVEEVIAVAVAGGEQAIDVPVARGLGAADVTIESDDATIVGWALGGGAAAGTTVEARSGSASVSGILRAGGDGGQPLVIEGDGVVHLVPAPEVLTGEAAAALHVQVTAAHLGTAHLTVRYLTDRLTWQASYTLIAHGDRGRLHGALAFDNRTGRSWEHARLAVIDRNRPTGAPGQMSDRAVTIPGDFAVRPGPQRFDLELRGGELPLVPTLIYDPVGGVLDSATMRPQPDEDYGVKRWPSAVDESVKIDLSRATDGPLPAGPIRVFDVGDGGALIWRGEGKLLPPADNAELYTTVAVGRAPDLTGVRQRTDFFIDNETMRLIEEYTVTVHNARPTQVDVLVREHLYRGQCWTLAYHSTGDRVAKEGAQQIGMGVTVPGNGQATVMYRVLYEWDESKCRASASKI